MTKELLKPQQKIKKYYILLNSIDDEVGETGSSLKMRHSYKKQSVHSSYKKCALNESKIYTCHIFKKCKSLNSLPHFHLLLL